MLLDVALCQLTYWNKAEVICTSVYMMLEKNTCCALV